MKLRAAVSLGMDLFWQVHPVKPSFLSPGLKKQQKLSICNRLFCLKSKNPFIGKAVRNLSVTGNTTRIKGLEDNFSVVYMFEARSYDAESFLKERRSLLFKRKYLRRSYSQ